MSSEEYYKNYLKRYGYGGPPIQKYAPLNFKTSTPEEYYTPPHISVSKRMKKEEKRNEELYKSFHRTPTAYDLGTGAGFLIGNHLPVSDFYPNIYETSPPPSPPPSPLPSILKFGEFIQSELGVIPEYESDEEKPLTIEEKEGIERERKIQEQRERERRIREEIERKDRERKIKEEREGKDKEEKERRKKKEEERNKIIFDILEETKEERLEKEKKKGLTLKEKVKQAAAKKQAEIDKKYREQDEAYFIRERERLLQKEQQEKQKEQEALFFRGKETKSPVREAVEKLRKEKEKRTQAKTKFHKDLVGKLGELQESEKEFTGSREKKELSQLEKDQQELEELLGSPSKEKEEEENEKEEEENERSIAKRVKINKAVQEVVKKAYKERRFDPANFSHILFAYRNGREYEPNYDIHTPEGRALYIHELKEAIDFFKLEKDDPYLSPHKGISISVFRGQLRKAEQNDQQKSKDTRRRLDMPI